MTQQLGIAYLHGCFSRLLKFEPYDCRYWAAFYLFLRKAILVIFSLTQSGYFVVVNGILLAQALFRGGEGEPGTQCLRMRQNSQKSWEFGFVRKISRILLRVLNVNYP